MGALGDPWPVSRIAQTAVTTLDLGDREARKNSMRLRTAPMLGLLVTPTDERSARVRAGQVYERVALTACAEGLATHPMSQILELSDERDELAVLAGIEDGRPQHLFRLGSADETPTHTPRWPLKAILSDGS